MSVTCVNCQLHVLIFAKFPSVGNLNTIFYTILNTIFYTILNTIFNTIFLLGIGPEQMWFQNMPLEFGSIF